MKSVLWADEVVVVDSFEDRTAELAESLGAKVAQVKFKVLANYGWPGLSIPRMTGFSALIRMRNARPKQKRRFVR